MADARSAGHSEGRPAFGQFAGLRVPVLISGVLPVLIYLLASPHIARLPALAVAAVPPVLYSSYGWVRRHGIDLISAITLFTLTVSMLLAVLVHDPRVLLLRDACLTGAFGLLCLVTLMSPRPMTYYVYRWAFVRTPERLASLDAAWQMVPYARWARRFGTAVWGSAFLAEALLDALLAYQLPTAQFVAIHPFLFWGTIVVVFGWATLYARNAEPVIAAGLRQAARERAAEGAQPKAPPTNPSTG